MPNFQDQDKKDFHTCYVVTVTYNKIGCPNNELVSYQLTLRYSQFKELHEATQRYLRDTFIGEPFPLSTVSQSLFGK